jgi:hypothetical protein
MDELLRRVRAARRRLTAARGAQLAIYYVLAAALVAAALAWVARWTMVPVWPASGAALGAAMLAAMVHAVATRPSMRTAALALDRATGLEERVTTALSLREAASPAAAAVIADAIQAVRAADASRIAMDRPRRAAWLAAPALLLVAGLLLPDLSRTGGANSAAAAAAETAVVPAPIRKEQRERLNLRAFELEKRAREQKRPELKDLAEAMRDASEELRKPEIKQSEALAKLSRVEEKAKERRDELSKDPKFADNVMKRIDEKDGSGVESAEAAKKAAALDKKLEELQQKLEKAKKAMEDASKQGGDAQKLKEALKELGKELDDLEGRSFDDIGKKLDEMAEGAGAPDEKELEKLLESLDGEMQDLDGLLDEFEALGDELEALGEMKGRFAGKCPMCGKPGGG